VGHIKRIGEMYEVLAGNPKWKTCGMFMDTVLRQPQEHKLLG